MIVLTETTGENLDGHKLRVLQLYRFLRFPLLCLLSQDSLFLLWVVVEEVRAMQRCYMMMDGWLFTAMR